MRVNLRDFPRSCILLGGWLAALAPGAWGAAASATDLQSALSGPVEAIRAIAPRLGVHVVDLGGGGTVFERAADDPLILASNTKLFTTAAALDLLGPGHQFETEVLVRGPVVGGELRGDLAVIGGGDPNISGRWFDGDPLAIFRRWAAELRTRGVTRIRGDLILVDGIFDRQLVHPDWPRDQLSQWYEAPVAGLSFNDNCLLVRVAPAPRDRAAARWQKFPDLSRIQVDNLARTTAARNRHVIRIDMARPTNDVRISGAVYLRSGGLDSWVAVADPVGYFGTALRQALVEEGIEIGGQTVTRERVPTDLWRPVAAHRSDLLTTLEVINKRSQNFYAESVLKLLGARQCGEGSWAAGVGVVEEWLAGIGLDPATFSLADGSGMSRRNRFSARQVTHLLSHMFGHALAREYLGTLAISGESDLKWEDRLAEPPYRDNIFAKTGTLMGVSTLSGYAKGRSGRVYAFAILGNRTRANWRMPDAQDELLRALVDHG
jgi:D-alanyl-D-alanine carboxypeptidase/D-alanyl-D-alanine-endopeptidase (penicillin-binding protein 4)